MVKSLLSAKQKSFLKFVASESLISKLFYFTGGTALSEFYLRHRFSEDLDFFSEQEFEVKDINLLLNSKRHEFNNPKIEFKQSFNRNIFQLLYPKGKFLKVEFTHFPFKRIETKKRINNLQIDSLIDLSVNKLFTIYQNPRGRDYFDLYLIFKKYKQMSIKDLIKFARIKFDIGIDYLQLGTNMIKVTKVKDDPILKKDLSMDKIEAFFLDEASKLKDKIIK